MVIWLERIGSVDKGLCAGTLYVVLYPAGLAGFPRCLAAPQEREAAAENRELEQAHATGVDWATTSPGHPHSARGALQAMPIYFLFRVAALIIVSLFTGWLAGISRHRRRSYPYARPCFYLVGCPTHLAVGTDAFEVAFPAFTERASLRLQGGRVELMAAPDRAFLRRRYAARRSARCRNQVRQGLRHPFCIQACSSWLP